jgi:subtilisin family serine protease
VIDPGPPLPPAPPPARPARSRWTLAVVATVVLAVVAAAGAVVVHRLSSGGSVPAADVPGLAQTPAPGACVDEAQARSVWSDVTARLDALVLHPDVSRVDTVAQGTAAQEIRAYLEQTLLDKHLHEREQERLDALQVVQRGCGGVPLTVRATETLVRDDYLAPDGHVDHTDSGVGQTHDTLESYVRSGGSWKLIALATLGGPTPTDQGQTI